VPPLGVDVAPPLGVTVVPPLGVDVELLLDLPAVPLLEELVAPPEMPSAEYDEQAEGIVASDTAARDKGTSRESSFNRRLVVIWISP
jgi:hypothetical protein